MKLVHSILLAFACANLVCAAPATAAKEVHSIKLHSTKIPDGCVYNVYAYREPIVSNNFALATRIATSIPSTEEIFEYSPSYTGDHYFLVTFSNQQGQETVKYQDGTGPVGLVDTTAPPAPEEVAVDHADGTATLVWAAHSLVNPDGVASYAVYRGTDPKDLGSDETRIKTVKVPADETNIRFADTERSYDQDGMFYYSVAAIDSAGNRSDLEIVVKSAVMPDLAFSSATTIRENKDISLSKTHPVLGQKLDVSLRIWNRGMTESLPAACVARMTEKGGSVTEKKSRVVAVKPGESHEVSFAFTPREIGECKISFAVDSDQQLVEINEDNNTAAINLHVVDKDYYFVWYGSPLHMDFANVPQVKSKDRDEWKRRGAWACRFAGVKGKKEALKKSYSEWAAEGYSGMLVDEIGGAVKHIEGFLSMLPELRREHPDVFIAVWSAGGIPEEVAQLMKDGVIDLVLLEIYINHGSDYKERLGKSIERARKSGCIEKTIIGLGSAAKYANYSTPESHAAFLEEQIQFIRQKAPEMPGVGFFVAKTLPGVDVALDEMCFKYFIQKGDKK
ncbi:MAG: CARDB domain-containing protein [Fuerstiella sp.]